MECKLPDFAQEDYYLNKKNEEVNMKAELFKQAVNMNKDSNQTVTSITIYRDTHCNADSVLVGFKGKSHYESGVIYIKRPSKLQILIDRIKSLFRKKKHDNGIELYAREIKEIGNEYKEI